MKHAARPFDARLKTAIYTLLCSLKCVNFVCTSNSTTVCLVQALGKVRVDVQELAVDYLTVVGHKFYGPRAGALYARGLGEYLKSGPRGRGAPLYPMLSGGGQERGLRPG